MDTCDIILIHILQLRVVVEIQVKTDSQNRLRSPMSEGDLPPSQKIGKPNNSIKSLGANIKPKGLNRTQGLGASEIKKYYILYSWFFVFFSDAPSPCETG